MVFRTKEEREAFVNDLMASGGYGQAAGLNLMALDVAANFVGGIARSWIQNSYLKTLKKQEEYYAQSAARRAERIKQLDKEITQLDKEITQLDKEIAQLDKEIAELDEISKKARQDLYETRVRNYIEHFYKARDNMAEIQKLRPEALRLGLHEVVAKVDKWLNRVFSKRFYAPKDMSPASIVAFAHECARRNSDTESLGMIAVASVTRQSKENLAEAIRAKKQELGTIELG
ncbi:septum formation initiator family protein [Hydrogenophilus thermoluteolus]|uniref:Uncharacterized protein n=1 Tax=Hydrogenophilus thermoluteolus TaxID=297 RepID=A0A2Z6E1A6_HYDTE|nr:hypothetical protein [Hydrogenophilus thermoluteolus]BBD78370.1 hypothetical protein HPTL_P025 [Hydrogenophilus thermoluteolus]